MRRFWILYVVSWVPLILFYGVATQGNAVFNGELQIFDALIGAAWSLATAPILLALVWPLTGWLDRRRGGALFAVLIHTAAAVLFVAAWHAIIFFIATYAFGPENAKRSAQSFFVWQGMWGLMMYAVVTGVFPLSVGTNAEADVELVGVNLPPKATVRVKAGAPGEVEVPLDAEKFRARGGFKVLAAAGPQSVEHETNDLPASAEAMPVPGVMNGRINGARDADCFRVELGGI